MNYLIFIQRALISFKMFNGHVILSMDLEINEEENEEEDVCFYKIAEAAIDSQNNFYIYKEKKIYKLNEEGKFQKKIRRSRRDPREFEKQLSVDLK